MTLKIQHLQFRCDTKTKDNVFVHVEVAVQYRVKEEKVSSAFYRLTDPAAQIKSYVFDVIRSSIPALELDEAFASKDTVAHAVRDRLSALMEEYGYVIIAALIVDLDPDQHVKYAMNEINASQRLREAASEKADAEKILQVKAAEADAESKYLAGMGVARQRKAIVDGLRSSVGDFSGEVGTTPQDVMDLLLVTQYFDMIRDMGKMGTGSSLFVPHGPQAVGQLRKELKDHFKSGFATPRK
jgi:regulator of protease activity HflC (stomatin/prohibitin superfamily)